MERAKSAVALSVSYVADALASESAFLALEGPDKDQIDQCNERFKSLCDDARNAVFHKVWELAKMDDSTVSGLEWGRDHCHEDRGRFERAMHRLGLLGAKGLFHFVQLTRDFGEGGLGSQYYSFSELQGQEPKGGFVSVVNGMGVQSLEHAGRDASVFSLGFNLHCVYNPTHQQQQQQQGRGFGQDVLRMKAVDGGSYTRTTHLIAQQIVDLLQRDPTKRWLQIALSEGAAMCNGALRLLSSCNPKILHRLSVLLVAPAHFLPECAYEGVEIINIFKEEDRTILPFATNASSIREWKNVITVPHRCAQDDPHNFTTSDYLEIIHPLLRSFHEIGHLKKV